MATTIVTKKRIADNTVPQTLAEGELAVNLFDNKLYVGPIGGGVGVLLTASDAGAVPEGTDEQTLRNDNGVWVASDAIKVSDDNTIRMPGALLVDNSVTGTVLTAGNLDDPGALLVSGSIGEILNSNLHTGDINLAGIAVAGGQIISDGSGAQDVTNTFGISSCVISGNLFVLTLSSPITVDNDMYVTLGAPIAVGVVMAQWSRTNDSTFNIVIADADSNVIIAAGINFGFSVYDAGR